MNTVNTVNDTNIRWLGPIASYEAEPIDDDTFGHPGGPAPILGGYRPVKNEDGQWTAHCSYTPLRFEDGKWWVGAPAERPTQRAVRLLREAERQGVEIAGEFTTAERIVAGLKGCEQTPSYGYWLAQQIRLVEAALLIGTARVRAIVEGIMAPDPAEVMPPEGAAEATVHRLAWELRAEAAYQSPRGREYIVAALEATPNA